MASKLATIIADFRTSLATKISVGGTSGSLQSATDDDGVSLPAGKYFFTADGDSSQKEHFVCDLSGTSMTNIKSISRQGAQTSGVAREHRIGASVVITNFAHILYINNLLDGTDPFEEDLTFTTATFIGVLDFSGSTNPGLKVNSLTSTQRDALVSPGNGSIIYNTTTGEFNIYQGGAWSTMASGSTQPDASTTVAGKVEIATVAEQGAGTGTGGTGAILVVTSGNLIKTSSGAGDENKIPVLGATGAFADGFLNAATSGVSKTVKSTSEGFLDPTLIVTPMGFGDGSDGDVTIAAGTTTLTKDMYYDDLTIQTGGIIDSNGFRIFVKGTLTFQGTGKITNNGGNGGAGGNGGTGNNAGTAGSAGAAASTGGSLPDTLAGFVGGKGDAQAAGGTGNAAGTAGTAVAKSLGSAGVAGGNGGTGGNDGDGGANGVAGAAGGAGGAQTGTVFNKPYSIMGGYYLMDTQPSVASHTVSGGSGGGGGGGGGGNASGASMGAGGGGGGSGAPGGIVWLSARVIVTVNGNNYIEAIGGNGANGGNGGNASGGNGGAGAGGGGGAAGSGGVVIVFYHSKTGTGTISVAAGSAGSAGAAGTAHGTGTAASAAQAGTAGNAGVSYLIQI